MMSKPDFEYLGAVEMEYGLMVMVEELLDRTNPQTKEIERARGRLKDAIAEAQSDWDECHPEEEGNE